MKKIIEEYTCDVCNGKTSRGAFKTTIVFEQYMDVCNTCMDIFIRHILTNKLFITRKDCPNCAGKGFTKEYYGGNNEDYASKPCKVCVKFKEIK